VHLGCALTIGARLRWSHGPNDGIFLHPFVRDACTPCALESCLRLRCVSLACLCRWYRDSIPVAGWLGDHEEACVLPAAIEDLMRRLRGHGEAGGGGEAVLFTVEFDGELAGEDVEELRRALMHVTLLCGAGRHALFDHAEGVGAMEVPAVTRLRTDSAGPGVVLGIVGMDGLHASLKSFTLSLRRNRIAVVQQV
jgi:hypothetical protein